MHHPRAFPMERMTCTRILLRRNAMERSRLRRVTRRVLKILPPQQSAHVQGGKPVAIVPHAQFRAKRQMLLLRRCSARPRVLLIQRQKCQFAAVVQLRTVLNSLAASRRRRRHQRDGLNSCGSIHHAVYHTSLVTSRQYTLVTHLRFDLRGRWRRELRGRAMRAQHRSNDKHTQYYLNEALICICTRTYTIQFKSVVNLNSEAASTGEYRSMSKLSGEGGVEGRGGGGTGVVRVWR